MSNEHRGVANLGLVIAIILMLAACENATTRSKDDLALGEDVAVQAEILAEEGRELVEGDVVTVRLTIENRLIDRNVLLARLFPALSDEGGIAWQNTEWGKLSYFRRDDAFYLYDDPLQSTEPVFNHGFIPPRGSLALTMKIRLLNMPRRFELKYYRLSIDETAQSVYFPEQSSREYRTFRKSPKGEIEAMLLPRDEKPRRNEQEESRIHEKLRVVLFQPTMLHRYSVSLITIDRPIRRRTFSAEQAARRIGAPAGAPHTYCSALNSWIIRRGERTWMVNEREERSITSFGFDVFQTIDSAPAGSALEIDVDMTTPASFTGRKNIVTARRGSRTVPILYLKIDELTDFLAEIERENLTIESPAEWGQRRLILKKRITAPQK